MKQLFLVCGSISVMTAIHAQKFTVSGSNPICLRNSCHTTSQQAARMSPSIMHGTILNSTQTGMPTYGTRGNVNLVRRRRRYAESRSTGCSTLARS